MDKRTTQAPLYCSTGTHEKDKSETCQTYIIRVLSWVLSSPNVLVDWSTLCKSMTSSTCSKKSIQDLTSQQRREVERALSSFLKHVNKRKLLEHAFRDAAGDCSSVVWTGGWKATALITTFKALGQYHIFSQQSSRSNVQLRQYTSCLVTKGKPSYVLVHVHCTRTVLNKR